MLSVSDALKLKGAGLTWTKKRGDTVFDPSSGDFLYVFSDAKSEEDSLMIWIPRLDQLLEELTARGYGYEMRTITDNHMATKFISTITGYCIRVWELHNHDKGFRNYFNSIEEAAFNALLRVLQNNL